MNGIHLHGFSPHRTLHSCRENMSKCIIICALQLHSSTVNIWKLHWSICALLKGMSTDITEEDEDITCYFLHSQHKMWPTCTSIHMKRYYLIDKCCVVICWQCVVKPETHGYLCPTLLHPNTLTHLEIGDT